MTVYEQEDLSLMLDSDLPANSKDDLKEYIIRNTCPVCPLEGFLEALEKVPEEDLEAIRRIQKDVVAAIDRCKFSALGI